MADYENLTDEQIAWIRNLIYNENKYSTDADKDSFVIPFISMNNGYTPAEIRAESAGLYKDIQRSPFIRKTGIISSKNTINDIDITSLVYYGTLEQSKIAPTLENIDIKLYIREPKLKKVITGTSDEFADSYVWREIQPGFHVYNNDTVYGYEWLVLQDDYVNTDGIYNLHMNIEDGIGLCKFAGTQAPINLAGVQYKIIITAKNLWSREYSLLENVPVLHTMYADNDDLSPTVNAIKEYYSALVDTSKAVADYLEAGSGGLVVDREGNVKITNSLSLEDIENVHDFIVNIKNSSDSHINSIITNGVEITPSTPHGISNNGVKGNINAAKLAGAAVSNGVQAITYNLDTNSYIPFVDSSNQMGLGTILKYYERSSSTTPSPLFQEKYSKSDNILKYEGTSLNKNLTSFLSLFNMGSFTLNTRISKDTKGVNINLTSGSTNVNNVNLETNKITTTTIDFGGNTYLNADVVAININNSSSIAYKKPISELLGIKVKVKYPNLTPNISKDADGNIVDILETTDLEDDNLLVENAESGFDKLGSALQALYELPLATFKYKRGQDEYKDQIGIFVERVNQIRDHLKDLKGSGEDENGYPTEDNLLVRKRNTLIKSDDASIKNWDKGLLDVTSERAKLNAYTYTDEEIKSIAHYLDLTTSKKELAQELRNTVGILLKAAKESQERLLNVETAVYGWDSETVPGSDDAKTKFLNSHIAKDLQDSINNNPLLLGLNRLVRAICLELYDTTDLETIDAETNSRLTDSDTLGTKSTVKSRMDQIDEIMDLIISQQSAMLQFYKENIENDESRHTYTNMVWSSPDKDKNGTVIVGEEGTSEDLNLTNLVKNTHKINTSDTVTVDQGGLWKNLPEESEFTPSNIDSISFGEISDTYNKHSPSKDETGVVRIPTIENPTKKENVDGKTVNRDWQTLKLNGIKDVVTDNNSIAGTYKPYFTSKLVAWDSAKLQRVNNKLSEVTHALYGVDDVIQGKPNRLEVIKRNVTNLIDDLYPNRSFRVEMPRNVQHASKIDIYEPFKTSKKQDVHGTIATSVNDEKIKAEHTSIIHWLDNELFNFTIENHFVGNNFKKDISTIQASKKAEVTTTNVQIKNSNTGEVETHEVEHFKNGSITFDTSKLITDKSVNNLNSNLQSTYDTYGNAYSKLDVLSSIIGIEDCYIGDLFGEDTLSIDGISYLELKDTIAIGYNSQNSIKVLTDKINTSQLYINQYTSDLSTYETDLNNCQNLQDTLSNRKAVSTDQLKTAEEEELNLTARANQNEEDITTCDNLIKDVKEKLEVVNKKLSELDSKVDYNRNKIGFTNNTYFDKESNSNKPTINQQIEAAKNQINQANTNILDYNSNITRIDSLKDTLGKVNSIISNIKDLPELIASNNFDASKLNESNFICVDNDKNFCSANATFTFDKKTLDENITVTTGVEYKTEDRIEFSWTKEKAPKNGTWKGVKKGDRYYNGSLWVYSDGSGGSKHNLTYGNCSEAEVYNVSTKSVNKITNSNEHKANVYLCSCTCKLQNSISENLYGLNNNPYIINISGIFASIDNSDLIPIKNLSNYKILSNKNISEAWLSSDTWDTSEFASKYGNNSDHKSEGGNGYWVTEGTNTDSNYVAKFDTYDTVNKFEIPSSLKTLQSYIESQTSDSDKNTYKTNRDDVIEKLGNSSDQTGNTYYAIYNQLQKEKTRLEKEIENDENSIDYLINNEYDIDSTDISEDTGQKKLMKLREVHNEHLKQLNTSKAEIESGKSNISTQINNLNDTIRAMDASIANIDTQKVYINERIKQTKESLNSELIIYEELSSQLVDIQSKVSDNNPLPYYADELSYIDFLKNGEIDKYKDKTTSTIDKGNYKIVKRITSDDISFATNVSYVLSRKQKPLQARITTLESFADAITEAYNFQNMSQINKVDLTSAESALTNIRFEALQGFTSTIKRNLKLSKINQLKSLPRSFDLDLSDNLDNEIVKKHNRFVWQRIIFASDIIKTNYTENGYYTIAIVDPIIRVEDCEQFFPFNESLKDDTPSKNIILNIINYFTFHDIKVSYVNANKNLTPDNLDPNTIYLKKKVTTPINWQSNVPNAKNPIVAKKTVYPASINESGFQNQTEYNIYKTISDIANSFLNHDVTNPKGLYYQMMLSAHPIGSVYLSKNATDPSKLFGGTWEARNGYLIAATDDVGKTEETLDVTKLNDFTVTTDLSVNGSTNKNNLSLKVNNESINISQPTGSGILSKGAITESEVTLTSYSSTIDNVITFNLPNGLYDKNLNKINTMPAASQGNKYYNISSSVTSRNDGTTGLLTSPNLKASIPTSNGDIGTSKTFKQSVYITVNSKITTYTSTSSSFDPITDDPSNWTYSWDSGTTSTENTSASFEINFTINYEKVPTVYANISPQIFSSNNGLTSINIKAISNANISPSSSYYKYTTEVPEKNVAIIVNKETKSYSHNSSIPNSEVTLTSNKVTPGKQTVSLESQRVYAWVRIS